MNRFIFKFRETMKTPFKIIILIATLFLIPFQVESKDSRGNHLVILDAGHGGADSGVKLSAGTSEKEITLELVTALKNKLEQSKNIRVVLTRTADQGVSFQDRIRLARDSNAELFISFHVNAGFDRNASGYEMYFPGFRNPSEVRNDSAEIVKDMVRTKSLNESVRFAKIVQTNLDKLFPRKGRGLREAPVRFENLAVPAVALEIGFATNGKDRKSILDSDVKKAMVGALDESVRDYFGSL